MVLGDGRFRNAAIAAATAGHPIAGALATAVLTDILERPHVRDVAMEAAPTVAAQVVEAVRQSPDIAIVPVKSAWFSKINWSAAGIFASSGAAMLGYSLDAQVVTQAGMGISAILALAIWLFRTFWPTSATKAAGSK